MLVDNPDTENSFIFGGRTGYQNAEFTSAIRKTDVNYPWYIAYGNKSSWYTPSISLGSRWTIDKNKGKITYKPYQSSGYSLTQTTEAFQSNSTLTIFALNNSNTISSYSKMKLYSFKLYDNDTLIRDYIPVLYHEKACLYDKISGEYYYNQGSGNFIAGSRKGKKITVYPVEYIESSGTQFIDTGVIYDYNTTQFDIDFQFRDEPLIAPQYLSVSWSGSKNDAYILGTSSSTKFICGTAQSGSWTQVANYDTNRHTWRYNDSQHKIYIDNTVISNKTTTTPNGLVTMRIFRGPGNNNPANARIYSYKITNLQTGELIRDFIPVRTQNNEYCLYDKVSKKIFQNKGDGNFLGGEDLNESAININVYSDCYYRLDSLFLADVRYIDTDVKAGPNTRIVLDCKPEAVKNQNRFFSTSVKNDYDGAVVECYINGNGNFAYAYNQKIGNWKQVGNGVKVVANTRYTIDLNGKAKTFKVSNGASISETLTSTTAPTSYSYQNILLGSDSYYHTNISSLQDSNMWIYSCQIYDNNVLIRDFIPVEFDTYIFEEGGFGLLDRVHNVFYPVQGFHSRIRYSDIGKMNRISDLTNFTGMRPVYQMYGNNTLYNNYKINFNSQEYYQLDSVDTDGCVVNTGIKLTTSSKLEMKFSFNALVEQDRIFDFPNNAGFCASIYIVSGSSRLNGWVNKSNVPGDWRGPTPTTTETATIAIFDIKNGTFQTSGGMTYSGTQLIRNAPTAANSGDLFLFSSAGGWNQTKMKFYYLKIYENDVLTHEIVPVKNTKTNEIILYDSKTNQIYRNIGPGNFKNAKVKASSSTISANALEGYFYNGNGSHTISTSYNGFTLIGKKANPNETFNTNIRWYTSINTRVIKRVSFLAQMKKVHGYIWGGLYDGTNFYQLWSSGELNYHAVREGELFWKKFDIDLSGFNGIYQIWFCGGRDNNSGNTDSATSYRDITFIGAKEIKRAYVNVQAPNLFADGEKNYGILETAPTYKSTNGSYTYYPATDTQLPYCYATYNATTTATNYSHLIGWDIPLRRLYKGHRYIWVVDAKSTTETKKIIPCIYYRKIGDSTDFVNPITGSEWTNITSEWATYSQIITPGSDWMIWRLDVRLLGPQETANASELYIRNMRLYDLTEIFGNSANTITTTWWETNMVPLENKYFRDIKTTDIDFVADRTQTLTKIEYLECLSTGVYLDTKIRMPYGFRATGKIEFTEITASQWNQIIGSQSDADPYNTNALRITNSGYWATGDTNSTIAPVVNTPYVFDVSTRMNGAYLKIDDTTVINNYTTTWRSNYPLYLFNVNNAGTPSNNQGCKMKLYWLKIYDASNKLIADYIPVKGKGLYDTISNQILYGSSDNSFQDGPVLEETINYIFKSGRPRLTFERDKIIEFSNDIDIIPHSWVATSIESNFHSREAYSPLGFWLVRSDSNYQTSNAPYKALDGDDSTYFRSDSISKNTTQSWYLQCPQPINPMQIETKYRYGGTSSNPPKILGYNIDTHAWEQIVALPYTTSIKTETTTISKNKFYSAFKFEFTRYSTSSSTGLYLYTFKIVKGQVMLTPGINNLLGYQTFTNK